MENDNECLRDLVLESMESMHQSKSNLEDNFDRLMAAYQERSQGNCEGKDREGKECTKPASLFYVKNELFICTDCEKGQYSEGTAYHIINPERIKNFLESAESMISNVLRNHKNVWTSNCNNDLVQRSIEFYNEIASKMDEFYNSFNLNRYKEFPKMLETAKSFKNQIDYSPPVLKFLIDKFHQATKQMRELRKEIGEHGNNNLRDTLKLNSQIAELLCETLIDDPNNDRLEELKQCCRSILLEQDMIDQNIMHYERLYFRSQKQISDLEDVINYKNDVINNKTQTIESYNDLVKHETTLRCDFKNEEQVAQLQERINNPMTNYCTNVFLENVDLSKGYITGLSSMNPPEFVRNFNFNFPKNENYLKLQTEFSIPFSWLNNTLCSIIISKIAIPFKTLSKILIAGHKCHKITLHKLKITKHAITQTSVEKSSEYQNKIIVIKGLKSDDSGFQSTTVLQKILEFISEEKIINSLEELCIIPDECDFADQEKYLIETDIFDQHKHKISILKSDFN